MQLTAPLLSAHMDELGLDAVDNGRSAFSAATTLGPLSRTGAGNRQVESVLPLPPGVNVDLEGFERTTDFKGLVKHPVFCGLPLYPLVPSWWGQYILLATGCVSSSLVFAAQQERVLYVPGFKFHGCIPIVQLLTFAVCALLERLVTGESGRRGTMWDYVKLSVAIASGIYLTNTSLKYLSYPLRVMFKACKLVPVMVLSVVYIRHRYSISQYISASFLVVGLTCFTMGDAWHATYFDFRGVVLIIMGTLFDAMSMSFEEKRMFSHCGCSSNEVALYSSCLGAVLAAVAEMLQGNLLPALTHTREHPETLGIIVSSSVAGYLGSIFGLLIIKHFSATLAELVKSLRKVLTICISFVLYAKPLSLMHVLGGFFFVLSLAVQHVAGKHSRHSSAMSVAVDRESSEQTNSLKGTLNERSFVI
eukprot:gnl/TRDRNA2_/TRDRNA2_73049_c0_seq1.p1 gnl/TRDRNA2_/TRDRNA2_73049_c0~~gnl/TRDRNA2_/TRDRNA2_73049_c0_seq1.p1  ORF type:complete len:419 (+),score=44.62 gnl/TRDRNA2_/TRDRNA2_73049_c0_seq1:33-1289(+)